jgi:hypothetical protein
MILFSKIGALDSELLWKLEISLIIGCYKDESSSVLRFFFTET